jgi:hypothetical protein
MVAVGAAVALVGLLVVSSVTAYVVLNWPDPKAPARDLVTRMAARDATASTFIDKNASLRTLAEKMGIVNVPGSAHLSIENLQVATPSPAPSASRPSKGDTLLSATYTLKWSGRGSSGEVDQTLTAVARAGTDGRTRLYQINVSPALAFDAAAYFGTSGQSEADAGLVADDLRAGVSWIPGVSVDVTPTVEAVTAPPAYTVVLGHLTTWTSVVSPAVDGSKTIWNVRVSGGGTGYADIAPASLVTLEPVAAKIDMGNILPSQADSGAIQTATAFWAALDAGHLATANSFIVTGPKLTSWSIGLMHGSDPHHGGIGSGTAAGIVTEGPTGIQDKIGDDVYVLGADGRWGIDSSRSPLAMTIASGKQGSYAFMVTNGKTGASACSTKITFTMTLITFFTDGLKPEAIFSIGSSSKCDVGDEIITATAGWRGNSGGTSLIVNESASSPGEAVYRAVILPGSLKPGMTPIWIKISKYGSPATGAYLPYTMLFSTY